MQRLKGYEPDIATRAPAEVGAVHVPRPQARTKAMGRRPKWVASIDGPSYEQVFIVV